MTKLWLGLVVVVCCCQRWNQVDALGLRQQTANENLFRKEWHEVEDELLSLQKIVSENVQRMSALQLSAAPEKAAAPKAASSAPVEERLKAEKDEKLPKRPSFLPPEKGAPASKSLAAAEKEGVPASSSGSFAKAAESATGALGGGVGMKVAQAMLEGVYEKAKRKVTELNKREVESKKEFAARTKAHEEKLKKLEADHNKRHPALVAHIKNLTDHPKIRNATLLNQTKARWAWMLKNEEGSYANATRNENRDFEYWTKVRESEKAQFRNILKMQHGTMDRVKTTLKLYDKVLSGNYDKKSVRRALDSLKGGLRPNENDVAFLDGADMEQLKNQQGEVERFVSQALEEVRQHLSGSASKTIKSKPARKLQLRK